MTTQQNGNNLLVQGRIIWGIGSSLFEGKAKTDYNTGAPVLDPQGNPKVEYGFGLAIAKNDPQTGQPTEEFTKIWNALHQEAFTLYPSGQIPPGFAMKFKDGDGIDHNGKPYADREGYAGHIILTCTTQIPIKYFRFEGGNNILVNDGIKVGDYVNVQLNIKAHPAKGNGKAGLYLNPSAVQLIQPGKEIINAPSGDQIFGAGVAPVYNGQVIADTAPQMPNVAAPQGMPGQTPAMPQGAPQMPQSAPAAAPQGMPAAAPQQPVADPHYGVVPQTHQPAANPAMPGQPQPGTPAMSQGMPTNGGAAMNPMGNGAPPAMPQTAPSVHGGMNNMAGTPAQGVATGMTPPMPGQH